ncbi:P-type conjugative transfer protein TrbL [Sphingomonas spermidinifaciens]|uniref:P-type conjugative transfer protein TrbL n=1 Tax=Sphingomonas spermidinifaciens TaxID=1141889 RepID=A0A2A4B375_9SPHN|nr:P-type conjugative transfer protein TrbL [Sphingomonas spermidinifaciens]PCD02239.1 P-type conjugative transfer protein TrbL [Sphingomonas spermidinifaciens]
MGGTGVVDRFLEVFTSYIDSGFGLLQGEVAFLATTLIVIDVTLAALFWTFGEGDDIIARLVKKTLFVGIFAYIIGNWNVLARIVFESFAGLGLKASGTGFTTAELLQPGRVAQVGLDAGRPIIGSISGLMGYISFFENFIQIVVLLFAWVVVLLAFFVLAVQLFITLIEFKLTVLCGFVLIPFGLFGKTAFMAERVLGHVISSGIKVLVLAVVVGIGSTLFSEFTNAIGTAQPTIEDAMAIVLGALCLLGLGIFGPAIASGIVSGGPQLGAGAAAGTALAAGGVVAAGPAAGGVALGAAGGALAGAGRMAGTATSAYRAGAEGKIGIAGVASGLGNVGRTTASSVMSPLRRAAGMSGGSGGGASTGGGRSGSTSAAVPSPAAAPVERDTGGVPGQQAGAGSAERDSGGVPTPHGESPSAPPAGSDEEASLKPAPAAETPRSEPPAWAKSMRRRQAIVHGASVATHTSRGGDSRGPGAAVSVTDKE